jgi:hypothetical protein
MKNQMKRIRCIKETQRKELAFFGEQLLCKMFQDLVKFSELGPKVFGSHTNKLVSLDLQTRLTKIGANTKTSYIQEFDVFPFLAWLWKPRTGYNVVAKFGDHEQFLVSDSTTQLIILGAHYDTTTGSNGFVDNASGVIAVLELAKRIKVQFGNKFYLWVCLFDAEEVGCQGSKQFVQFATTEEKKWLQHQNTLYFNLDSIIYGDVLCAYAVTFQSPIKTQSNVKLQASLDLLSQCFQVASMLDLKLSTSPTRVAPTGSSDYASFGDVGVVCLSFEKTNWGIGKKDGYAQSHMGTIWNSPRDSWQTVARVLTQDQIQHDLNTIVKLVLGVLASLKRVQE